MMELTLRPACKRSHMSAVRTHCKLHSIDIKFVRTFCSCHHMLAPHLHSEKHSNRQGQMQTLAHSSRYNPYKAPFADA